MMVRVLLDVAIIVLTLSTISSAVRIILGPSLPDRVVAADSATTHVIALTLLVGMRLESMLLFDIAIALAILSFFTSIVVGNYLEKGNVIDDVGDR